MSESSPKVCDATYSALAHAYHPCPDCGHLVMEHKNIDWTGVYGLPQQTLVQFSQTLDHDKWEPQGHSVWVGHPAIARGIVRFLRWLTG